jgi:potassium/hydrogen antiporter
LRGTALPAHLSRTLEAEAGFNDPVAVLLVLVTIQLIVNRDYSFRDATLFLVREVGVGVLVGAAIGWLARAGVPRAERLPTGLALVASLSIAAIAYGGAGALGGSGFLAVYMVGLALGDAAIPEALGIPAFHDGLASVAEIGMFLTLGLLVFPSQLGSIAVKGFLLAAIVAVVARPLAATLVTWREDFTSRERLLLGWAGIRGAVPVILATFAVISHVPRSIEFFNIVFFAVLVWATVQGLTIGPLAARLRLAG